MNKKIISMLFVLVMCAVCACIISCKNDGAEDSDIITDTITTEFQLKVNPDLAVREKETDENGEVVTEISEPLTTEQILEKGIFKNSLVQSADGKYTQKKMTAAYVFRDGGSYPCVALTYDSNKPTFPEYIYHMTDGKLVETKLNLSEIAGEETEFYFIKNSDKTLLRDYGDKDGEKYGVQRILAFCDNYYDYAKKSEYSIPYDDSSDLTEIRKNIDTSFERDVGWYLETENFETVKFSDVAVTKDVEQYLENELGFVFEELTQIVPETTAEE